MKKLNKEIDLVDIIFILWKHRLYILAFTIISITFAVYNISITDYKPKFKLTTKIIPLSTIDNTKYQIFNSSINLLVPKNFLKRKNINIGDDTEYNYNFAMNNLKMTNIDKTFLLDLFIEKLNDREYLVSLFKKYEFLKRENYLNISDYEKEIINLASSVYIENTAKNINLVVSNADDKKKWKNFFVFLERETNLEIRKKLFEIIEKYINHVSSINLFVIEDLNSQILISDENEKLLLGRLKNILISSKFDSRMKVLLDESPISNAEEFYAAKINYNEIDYSIFKNNLRSPTATIIGAIIFGLLIGIFFALLLNAIRPKIYK